MDPTPIQFNTKLKLTHMASSLCCWIIHGPILPFFHSIFNFEQKKKMLKSTLYQSVFNHYKRREEKRRDGRPWTSSLLPHGVIFLIHWKTMPMRAPASPLGGGKTPERWEFSQTSTNSARSSSSILAMAAKSFGSCFVPPDQEDTRTRSNKDDCFFKSWSSSSSPSSASKRSGRRGLYSSSSSKSSSKSTTTTSSSQQQQQQQQIGSMSFSMAEIHKATKNFSLNLKIGQGGFGTVYRGTLHDGTIVAVKRAKKSVYDNHLGAEFQSEIRTLARVEHLNLVRFLGYLECDDERIVVVEFVPNGTLREHLDDGVRGSPLDLAARLDIAIDVAHAVTYLHMYTDHPIIHRDIKSSNILLTDNLRAKVADFGFARLGATDTGVTHVSTQVKGTAGYLDPEYLRTYQLTEKSDVYSFGVLLVELMSGRRPIEPKRQIKERITTKWAMNKFMEGNAVQALDPNLPRSPATNLALEKVLELAHQCLAPTKQGRPSMRRCAEILWSIRKDYRELLSSDSLSQSQPSHQQKHSFLQGRE